MSGSDGLDGIVWAQNTDGLGERLRAILNGIALADRLGMPFRLSWEILRDSIAGDHSILPAREFFSEEFCDLYLEERDALEGRSTLLLEEFSDEQDAARSGPFNIIVTQTHLQTQARPIFAGTSVAPILEEADPPPMKWSSAMFRKTEEPHGNQATEARRNYHEVT
ncbi:hypothetical protein PVV74_22705, partial [Roseovarius sp. SK2]